MQSNMQPAAPTFPIGPQEAPGPYDDAVRKSQRDILAAAPQQLREAVNGLSDGQLDTKYRNWTIRQIVHHVADSHVQAYIRFKWTLTEATPTIKAYEEGDWVLLDDCASGCIEPSLALLDGLHSKWIQLVDSLQPQQFERSFVHPQTGETVSLWDSLHAYPWHGRHHTAQITWLREQHSW